MQQIDIGINWWIDKDVVVKVDYQDQSVQNSPSKNRQVVFEKNNEAGSDEMKSYGS